MGSWRLLVFALPVAFVTAGCSREESITRLEVTNPGREELRLLAAVVPENDESSWFFKLSGPAAEVARVKPDFDRFIASIRFDENRKPLPVTWTVPRDWQEEPAGTARLASFRIQADPEPMELTVTLLGGSKAQNIGRWRKQLMLPPLDLADLPDVAKPLTVGGREGYLVDMKGLGVHTLSKPEAARPAHKLRTRLPVERELPFTYRVPGDWRKGASSDIVLESYSIPEGGKEARFTLTVLGGNAGGLALNINRWRKQIGLPPLSEKEAERSATTLEVAGVEASSVDLNSPRGDGMGNHTLAVILPLHDETWFFKLTGPGDVVERHKAEFDDLIRSVQLRAKEQKE